MPRRARRQGNPLRKRAREARGPDGLRCGGQEMRAGNPPVHCQAARMNALTRLTDAEVLALGKFIMGCTALGNAGRWRTRFQECVQRGCFAPFSKVLDAPHLRSICERFGEDVVCVLRSSDVVVAANLVSLARGEGFLAAPGRTVVDDVHVPSV